MENDFEVHRTSLLLNPFHVQPTNGMCAKKYAIVHDQIRHPCSYLSLVSEFSVLQCSLGRDHELQFQPGLDIGECCMQQQAQSAKRKPYVFELGSDSD